MGHPASDQQSPHSDLLVPERRTGVVVLANSNTVPTSAVVEAALDVALGDPATSTNSPATAEDLGEGLTALSGLLPPVVRPVARVLASSGPDAAAATFHELSAAEPADYDLDDDEFEKAVWGAIELHRTSLVWPLLRLWTALRPSSSMAWTMTGWAHQVDGQPDLAKSLLHRALDLDPENGDAALILSNLPAG